MLTPTNLHLLIGTATPEQAKVIERILSERINLERSILELARHCPVKITFSEPVTIQRPRRIIWSKPDENGHRSGIFKHYNEGTEHIFKSGFWLDTIGRLCYHIRRGSSLMNP